MKKVNLQISLWFIAISCVLIVSCSKEENEPQLILSPESEMLFTNGIIFPAEGGEQSISFTIMNQTWWNSQITPTNSNGWCTVEYKYNFEQSNEVTAHIHVTENTEYNERCAQFIITVGNTQKEMNIRQKEKVNYLQLSEKQFETDYTSCNLRVEVNANCDYSININQEDKSWIWDTAGDIQYHPGNRIITFFIDDNNTASSRECEITFKGENVLEKIRICQVANPALNVSEDGSKAQAEIKKAGELPNILSTIDITKIQELTLKGYLNGTDFNAIYKMKNLTELDLSKANIISGGESYYDNKYFTKTNKISAYLFSGKGIKTILLPQNITSIEEYAFKQSDITSITIPASVQNLGKGAFIYCEKLQSIDIPTSITQLPEQFLIGAHSLSSISIPTSVNKIGSHAFYGCSSLSSIVIPHSVNYIGEHTFTECSNLSSAVLSNSIETDMYLTFYKCGKLTAITLPQLVKNVKQGAFAGCDALQEVYMKSRNVPDVDKEAFIKSTGGLLKFVLYVPNGCKNKYQESLWGTRFATEIIEK